MERLGINFLKSIAHSFAADSSFSIAINIELAVGAQWASCWVTDRKVMSSNFSTGKLLLLGP